MKKKFLVTDPSGIFTEHANGLAKGGNEVRFYTTFNYKYSDYAKGKDYDQLQKEMYFWEHIKWADSIVNFDVRNQDLIGFLRDLYPDKSVFGSGWGGKLEDDRILLKKIVSDLGLPEHHYEVVRGINNLREYLKKHPKVYVKINVFRDDCESFYSPDYETIESEVDSIADGLGAHKDEYDFVVEDAIETDAEIGFDGFFNGTDYLRPFLYGYEYHKNLYLGKVSEEMPSCLDETMSAFAPLLEKLKYRGALSTEEKIVSQEEHYLLDFCARMASPFTALYTEFITNWPDLVYGVGNGEDVIPEFSHKYVGAFTLKSQKANEMYIKVNIKDPEKVKMFMPMGSKKGNYAVKGEDHVAVVIAGGDSPKEVVELLKKRAKLVDANGLDTESVENIDKIFDVIKAGEEVGLKF
jgi:hypothetical protein